MPGVSKIIARRLVDLPLMWNDKQQAPARLQRTLDLPECAAGFAHMLQSHDVDAGVEGRFSKGQCSEIGDGIQLSVIPGGVADAEIDSDIMAPFEIFRVNSLTGSGIEHAGIVRKAAD